MTTRRMKLATGGPKRVNRGFSRRRFLTALGASAALAPFVPMLQTHASEGEFPKRLILLFSANGTLHENWVPSGGEANFSLSPILSPLQAHRDKLIILDGLRVIRAGPGDGHQMGMGSLWTGNRLLEGSEFNAGNGQLVGWGRGISLDQAVAGEVGAHTPYRSLEFGVQNGGATVWSRMCYAGSNQPIAPEGSPQAMFDRLFSDLGVDTAELDRLKAQRRSVIDLVKGDLNKLQTKLGGADKLKMDAHLEAVRAIEKRNDAATPACEAPPQDFGIDFNANDNFPAVSRLMIDQLVMSLACDLTRVASLQWSRSTSNVRHTWLGVPERHHDLSHLGDGNADMATKITAINTWYAGEVAYLLDQLALVSEGSGTMLDNSIVVWGNELSRGNTHGAHPVPFVIAGSGCGALETGRFLQYDQVAHNRLLVSISQAMGLSLQSFGDNDPGSGGLDGLT